MAAPIAIVMRSRRSRVQAGERDHGAGDRQRQPRRRQHEAGAAGVAHERAGDRATQRQAGRGNAGRLSAARGPLHDFEARPDLL